MPINAVYNGQSNLLKAEESVSSKAVRIVGSLTDIVLLKNGIDAREEDRDELTEDTLVRLHTQKAVSREVRGGQDLVDDCTHHPKGSLLLQQQQQISCYLQCVHTSNAVTEWCGMMVNDFRKLKTRLKRFKCNLYSFAKWIYHKWIELLVEVYTDPAAPRSVDT